MVSIQRELVLPTSAMGYYPITRQIVNSMPEIKQIKTGLLHLFLQHTSAALTINENADPDVLTDLEQQMNALAPDSAPYRHTLEGHDDMPAHIKSSLTGVSQTIPIGNGVLLLGTWQDIYLCEYRQIPHQRKIILTLFGTE